MLRFQVRRRPRPVRPRRRCRRQTADGRESAICSLRSAFCRIAAPSGGDSAVGATGIEPSPPGRRDPSGGAVPARRPAHGARKQTSTRSEERFDSGEESNLADDKQWWALLGLNQWPLPCQGPTACPGHWAEGEKPCYHKVLGSRQLASAGDVSRPHVDAVWSRLPTEHATKACPLRRSEWFAGSQPGCPLRPSGGGDSPLSQRAKSTHERDPLLRRSPRMRRRTHPECSGRDPLARRRGCRPPYRR